MGTETKQGFKERYRAFTEPTAKGLPNRKVVFIPLLILAAIFFSLVGLGITGSSSGVLNQFFSQQSDDRLIAGEPQAIRSDEWFVQTSWTISQVEQGLNPINTTFPGGMDSTVQQDLPSSDWSTIFRPHLAGFLFLPLDNAMAVKWWLPGFAMIAASYLFFVSVMPRRPIAGAALATGLFFSPFMQWWFLSITFWPPAWAFLVMATVVWSVKGASRRARITLAAITGYVTVVMGVGIYVPFILAAMLPAIAFAVGYALDRSSNREEPLIRRRLKLLLPLFVAGGVALVALLIWLVTRWASIQRFMGTVYPGERLVPTGSGSPTEWAALFGAPFNVGLFVEAGGALGPNASESSTMFLGGLFLFVPLIWLAIRRYRRTRELDAVLIALGAIFLITVLFLAVPGWDAISHLLFLDRMTPGRTRLLFGVLSMVMIAVLGMRIDEELKNARYRLPTRLISSIAALFAAGNVLWIGLYLRANGSILGHPMQLESGYAVLIGAVSVLYVASVWLSSRGWTTVAALVFLAMSIIAAGRTNPLYRGVYDLNDTSLVESMKELQGDSEGRWVGVGDSFLPNAVLMQSGLPSYNGFQSAPPEEMWEQIDPDDTEELHWNRLANVSWGIGEGEPSPHNPAADQIRMTFDSCYSFAQEHVEFVLSEAAIDQSCVLPVKTVTEGPNNFHLYKVVESAH